MAWAKEQWAGLRPGEHFTKGHDLAFTPYRAAASADVAAPAPSAPFGPRGARVPFFPFTASVGSVTFPYARTHTPVWRSLPHAHDH
ncbi:hypothetical protein GCM10010245_02520 [Streptomyces spectabilis]|nr:hypothetical protein GCM10010245_02520 [Streptomyces spectabilis]